MKKNFSKSVSWFLSVAMLFGVFLITNTAEIRVNAATQERIQITYDGQIVDSFNGVNAVYKTGTGNTNTGEYSCAGYVHKYYSSIYGVAVSNLVTGKTPNASNGSFSVTSSPEVGDIGYQTNSSGSGHWFIIKEVNGGGNFTVIEQNWKWASGGATYCSKNRNVSYSGTANFKVFRWSGKGSTQPAINPVPQVDPTPTQPTPVPAQQDDTNIKYAIDFIVGGENSISLQGWAFDGDDTSQALWIHVYIGGVVGDPNAEGHAIMANQSRQDVNDAYHCGENHGFSEKIQTDKIGDQPVYIYALNVGNGSINPCIGSFNVPISNATPHDDSPALFNPTVAKVSRNGYRVTCNINTTIGISKVLFPTWTEANGQDDIIYHEGTILGNTANVYIKTSEHNNEIGTYITHIYAYDQAGNALGMEGYGIVIRDDNEPYPLREAQYNGHRYVMYLADMSWTAAQNWCNNHGGYLATVTNQEEWNTIKWMVTFDHAPCFWLGAENTSGAWRWVTGEPFTYTDWCPGEPNCADGNEFYLGTYQGTLINAYLWNDFPNTAEQVGCFIFEEPLDKIPPAVTNPTVSRVSSKGYQVTCNIGDDWGVTKVLFPTWTDKNGQDDIIYYEGTISGNTATVYIPTAEHNNETGLYYTHIYAYDAEGNSGFAGTGVKIVDDEPYGVKSTEYNGHTYTMYLADMSWTEAQAWCEKQGGYLATVTSQEEWNTIKWLVTHNNAPCCWLGAESTSGEWKWVTGENFTYSDWLPGEPNCTDGREFYLGTYEGTLINAYKWNDFTEKTDLIGCFVMEEPLDKISPTVTNPTVSKVSSKGYQVTCNIEDNFGVTKVLFPTWTDKNEQDDVIYYEGTISGNMATVYIPTAEHNNETGLYHTHIYAYDAEGNSGFAGTACNVIDDEPYEMKSTEYNGHTYTMYLADMTWTEAQAWCKKQGGYLATVTSQEEWDTIKWLVAHNNAPCCWLGAESTSGSWKWVTGEDFTYSDWWTDQPDCGGNKEFYLGTYEGTLINAYRWNDFSDKNDLVGCFVMEKAQLENKSTISAETIKLGETVTANARATGGTGEYLYQVVYKQTTQSKWTTAQSYKANATVTFKPANATTYDVCIKVKDGNNTEIKKFFTVRVTSDELKNISTISAQTINLGSTVTVNAKATGSTGFYTYAVYYKQKAQTKWTTKQDFKANNTIAIKPAKATTYDICVKVKDDKGTIVKKYFTINVTDFKNTSTLSATEIKLGNTVKVSCSATGSTGYYQYAVYYKKTSDTKWTTKQSYSSNNAVTIKPAKATTYDVCVKVKDNQNNEVKKYFIVTVK